MPHFDAFAKGYEKRLSNRFKDAFGSSLDFFIKVKCDEMIGYLGNRGIKLDECLFLDLGCGTGIAEKFLDGRARVTIGIDSSISMLQSKQDGNRAVLSSVCGNALKTPFRNGSFDVVFSFCLFHHLKKKERATICEEMKRITKIGGYVFAFEHNPLNILTQYVVRNCEVDKDAILLGSGEMRRLFEDAGLMIKEARYILLFPEKLRLLEPLEKCLGWLPLGGQYFVVGQRIV